MRRIHLSLLPLLVLLAASPPPAQVTTLVSATDQGLPCNDNTYAPCLSDNGHFLVFTTRATDFAGGPGTGALTPFLLDGKHGTITPVAVDDAGTPANADSDGWGTSANGRLAVFDSPATNLVPSDTNAAYDVFVHDLKLGTTTRVSVSSAGDEADGDSLVPRISGNGRYVVFQSGAGNLVTPADGNALFDIYLRDLKKNLTERISLTNSGDEPDGGSTLPTVSSNGRWVAFTSVATNLVDGDTNDRADVFVRDRKTGTTTRVSVTAEGVQLEGGTHGSSVGFISGNGKYVAFTTDAPGLDPVDLNDLPDVYVRRLGKKGTVQRVSVGFDGADSDGVAGLTSDGLWISGNARWIAYVSSASNLVSGDQNGAISDVFVSDRVKHTTVVGSLAFDGSATNQGVLECAVSNSGKQVAFSSTSTNLTLVSGLGTPGKRQLYVCVRKK